MDRQSQRRNRPSSTMDAEHDRADDELRALAAEYRTVIDALDEGIELCEAIRDQQGRIVDARVTDVNPAFERHTGVPARTMVGHTLIELLGGDNQALIALIRHVLETGESQRIEYYEAISARWYDAVGVPRGGDRFVIVFTDITERKRLAQALATEAEQLDRIFEGIGDAVLVYDADGHVVRANAAAHRLLALDVAPPGFYGLSVSERAELNAPRHQVHGGERAISPDEWLVTRALQGGIPGTTEMQDLRMRALDGRELEVGASVAPLRDSGGGVTGAVLILQDRAERNRLAREREEARAGELAMRDVNQRLDTFVDVAVHDLRHPVAVTKLGLDVAQQHVTRAAKRASGAIAQQILPFIEVSRALATAEQSLDRLWQLMQQLLDVSRIREGTLVLDRQRVDLVDLVRRSVEEQRLLAPGRTISLDVPTHADGARMGMNGKQPGEQTVSVEGDPDRLAQVLTNYLANAVRYSPEDTPIEVALRVTDRLSVARIEVRDHGLGIPPEEQNTIWERFQRARNAREVQGGLGLGLYSARMLMELHGGQTGVESEPGRGSTFWFTLPLAPALANSASDTLTGEQPPIPTRAARRKVDRHETTSNREPDHMRPERHGADNQVGSQRGSQRRGRKRTNTDTSKP